MLTDGDLFHFNLEYLFFVGLWPRDGWTGNKLILYKMYEYFTHVLSLTFLVTTSIGSYKLLSDVTRFMSNVDKACVAFNFVFKVFFFIMTRERLRALIEEIQSSGDTVSEDRKKVMVQHMLLVTSLASFIASAFSLIALYKREEVIEAWYPFDAKKNFMSLLLSIQLLAFTFFIPCLYRGLGMQGIIVSIVIYFCEQLVEIQVRLKELKYSEETDRAMRDELKAIIRKHSRIIGYANTLKEINKEFFLVQNLAITFELCLDAIMVNMMGSENKTMFMSFLAYLSIALINAYIFCHMGNELIIKSIGVAEAAYQASWPQWPVDLQKNILIILTVAQRPLSLSAGGMTTMCMNTFGQALYNGYSLFTLLSDMLN